MIIVGGGSILVNPEKSGTLKGASDVICHEEYYEVYFKITILLYLHVSAFVNKH